MSVFTIAQLVISVILIVLVLLQERSSGASGLFGGGGDGGFYQARRGLERHLFTATILTLTLFAVVSLAVLIEGR